MNINRTNKESAIERLRRLIRHAVYDDRGDGCTDEDALAILKAAREAVLEKQNQKQTK